MSTNRSVAIDFDNVDDGGSNELGEYLIQREKSLNNNTITGFFTNAGASLQKIIPKRLGTGSIEDDIAVRFGFLSSSSVDNSTTNASETSTSGVCGRCSCLNYSLSRKERIIGFFLLLGMGLLFFTLSSFYIPVLIFKARKFSIMFTFGSVFTFASLSVLWGFSSFIKHLVSADRLVFTTMYFGSLFATLFFAMSLQSTILTVIAIIFQVISLLSFLISYLPGGISGIKYLTKFVSSSFMPKSSPI